MNNILFGRTVIAVLLAVLMTSSMLLAAPIETVTNTNNAGDGSLRQAILDVDPEGEIIFDLPGAAPHIITISNAFLINKSLTITGPGEDQLIIDAAGGGFSSFTILDGLVTTLEATISGLRVDGGNSASGGVVNFENLTMNNVVVTGYGNGVVQLGPTDDSAQATMLTLNDCLITDNSLNGILSVPGFYTIAPGSMITINRTTISNNVSGGIAIIGPDQASSIGSVVVVSKSTISGNMGSGIVNAGGDADQAAGGTLEVYNSTITNNNGDGIQTNGGSNGGLGATTRVSSSTITGNAFLGLINFGSDPLTEVKNSIVSQNAINNCGALDGTFTALGVNFSTDDTCPDFVEVTSGDLNLGPLQNNGGPTETHALIAPSVAINAVTDCTFINGDPVEQDQRCFFRTDDNCDAGAFQFGAVEQLSRNVPTLSTLGLITTVVLIGIAGAIYNRRRTRLLS